ncbi:MAG TPA: glycosyltransferase family A protein [Gallionellaceae bacterium]
MTTLTIYILCHNRPDDAREAIRSVLAQTDQNFQLIVSDNSSNDEVQHMVQREFPQIGYVRRVPMAPALTHFNLCIAETQDDYFCLFHDDDLMASEFVGQFRECARRFPQAVAIGCNAQIERMGQLEGKHSFLSYGSCEVIADARRLALRYFGRSQSGIAPFPGYVYNRRRMGDVLIPIEGGKYADVTWLLTQARRGPVVWINQPLMTYRLHASNDSNTESRRDRLRFLGYLKQNLATLGKGVLADYRCSFVYKRIRNEAQPGHPERLRLATRFLKHYRWARYTRADTYTAVFKRALTKWMTR